MRCELPLFKRCCFCLPLRYGLIAWGYLKLIIDTLIIASESYSLHISLYNANYTHVNFHNLDYARENIPKVSDIIFTFIILFIFVTDFVITAVYIHGGHTKNIKLLRVFYFYSKVMWVILVVLAFVLVGFSIDNILHSFYPEVLTRMWLAMDCSLNFLNIVLQTYVLLVLRSEIEKLNSSYEFKYVNNAAEAECAMTCKDDISNGEKGIEAA